MRMMHDPFNEPCKRCFGVDVVTDTTAGDVVCRSCGEIQVGRIIDEGAEWREFSEDDRVNNGSAARSSCTVDKYGSTTEFIGGVSEAARVALAKTQMMATDQRELKTRKATEVIKNIGSILHLTRNILDCAYHLCGRAIMENSSQAKRIEHLAAAVISLACRLEGYPRTLQEISRVTNLDVSTISRIQTILARDLQIVTGRVAAQDLVSRIVCNPLIRMTDPVTIQYAKDMCFNASEEGILDGQSPQASAAASIILIGAIRSIFNKKIALNTANSSGSKRPQIDLFRPEKGDVDIQITIDTALATLTTVKRAYTSLLHSASLVIPRDMKEKIMKSLSVREAECWHSELPTFDVLLKLLKANLQGEDKEKEKIRLDRLIRLENNKRVKLMKVKEEETKRQRVRDLNIDKANPLIKNENINDITDDIKNDIKIEIKSEEHQEQKNVTSVGTVTSSSSSNSHIAIDTNSSTRESSIASDTPASLIAALSIIKVEKCATTESKSEIEHTSKIEIKIEKECSGYVKISKEKENGLQQIENKKESSPSSTVKIKKEINLKKNCKPDSYVTSEEKGDSKNPTESCNRSRQKLKFAADSDDLLASRCPGSRSRKMQRMES